MKRTSTHKACDTKDFSIGHPFNMYTRLTACLTQALVALMSFWLIFNATKHKTSAFAIQCFFLHFTKLCYNVNAQTGAAVRSRGRLIMTKEVRRD